MSIQMTNSRLSDPELVYDGSVPEDEFFDAADELEEALAADLIRRRVIQSWL